MLTIYLVFLSYLLIAADSHRCKPQYLFSTEAQGWLKLHTYPASWEKALQKCNYEGAVLASPLDAGLVHALRLTMAQNGVNGPIFLGTHNLHSSDHFVSVEGVPLFNMEINWAPQINPNASGLCLTMIVNGPSQYLNVTSCKDSLPYICYRRLNSSCLNECGTFDSAYHLNKQTGSCYKVHHKKATWHNAYEICAAEGGHLVVIDDEEEALVIKNMIPTPPNGRADKWDSFFIGLFAYGDPLDWMTVNGDRIDDVYNDWDPGQPDYGDGIQLHGTIIRPGTLDNAYSGRPRMFVCEKSPTALLFEPSPVQYSEIEGPTRC
nr:secretory phospholipase A2 receptor [Helicoverpa armigera]